MAVEVYIPKFGQTVEEVKLLQWLAEDGAVVKKGQEILEIETDKTTFFVEAEGAGTLHRGPYQVDQTIPVLTVVAIIGAKDEAFKAEAKVEAETEVEAEVKAEPEVASTLALTSASKVAVSPRARKLAARRASTWRRPASSRPAAKACASPNATCWRTSRRHRRQRRSPRSWLPKRASTCAP